LTAAALARTGRAAQRGLRPVNPRTDMAQVADLIELGFRGELDAAGLQMVREMRGFGRAGWLGYQLSRWMLPPAAHPEGFVWQEAGRIVGNASLLSVEGYPERWVLANVAVHPDWRRRGIARTMVVAAIEDVRRRGSETVILQVAQAKREVQALYASLGFVASTPRTAWTRQNHLPPPAMSFPSPLQARSSAAWEDQWSFMRRLYPEGLIWPFPPEEDLFRPSGMSAILGVDRVRHWLWIENGIILASLTAQARPAMREWRVILGCAESHRGRLETPMLTHVLPTLPGNTLTVLEYPQGPADVDLRSLGFRAGRTLTWMALDLKSGKEMSA
jgi:ribosomal protein S18 acetylase RimI-like enzyme